MSLFRIRPASESGTHVYSLERARTRGAFKHGWSATKPLRAGNICYLKKTQPYCVFHIGDTHIGRLRSYDRSLDLWVNKNIQIKKIHAMRPNIEMWFAQNRTLIIISIIALFKLIHRYLSLLKFNKVSSLVEYTLQLLNVTANLWQTALAAALFFLCHLC